MATPTELSKELDHGLQFIFYQRINTYYELYILQVPRNIYYNSKLHAYIKLKKIKFKKKEGKNSNYDRTGPRPTIYSYFCRSCCFSLLFF